MVIVVDVVFRAPAVVFSSVDDGSVVLTSLVCGCVETDVVAMVVVLVMPVALSNSDFLFPDVGKPRSVRCDRSSSTVVALNFSAMVMKR